MLGSFSRESESGVSSHEFENVVARMILSARQADGAWKAPITVSPHLPGNLSLAIDRDDVRLSHVVLDMNAKERRS